MSPRIEKITETSFALGEGPHWDEKTRALYFVNLFESTVNKYDPKNKKHTGVKIADDKIVSIVVPVENETNKFLITCGGNLATIVWDGISDKVSNFKILHSLDGSRKICTNDGKVSPSGVLFVGTYIMPSIPIDKMNEEDISSIQAEGKLFVVTNDVKCVLDGIRIPNGMAWSRDENQFYFIDSMLGQVDGFDYDKRQLELRNRRPIFNAEKYNVKGYLDGMTIDMDGNLYVACYLGGQIIKINPSSGELLDRIQIPALGVTSVAFGGEDLQDLYVTTGKHLISDEILKNRSENGCLFRITGLGIKGLPALPFKLQ